MICDTSGLLAAFDADDGNHQAAREVLADWSGPLVLPPLVLAELDYLIRARPGSAAARTMARELVARPVDLAPFDADDLMAALAVDEQYSDLELGLADASIVVLSHRHRTRDVLTFDERHFRAVKPLQGGAFRLLPADA